MGCAMYCSVMQRPNYRLRKSYLTHYNVFFVEYILPLRSTGYLSPFSCIPISEID